MEIAEDANAVLSALSRSQAIIEFAMDGTILTANQNFLDALGFTLAEIQGQHHSIFLALGEKLSVDYQAFWDGLRRGEFHSGEYRRIAKGGREVWIQASYNPVLAPDGQPFKIVKLATDITALKLQTIEHTGKVEAIGRSNAVIEFALDGTILDANENFCRALGYLPEEIRGRHHGIFVTPDYRESEEYQRFWANLRQGQYQQAEFRRIHKNGQDVWIQATYNPILDPFGRTMKIVQFATNTTLAKVRAANDKGKLEAIDKSQAVIEFAMDGTILTANGNFLKAFGYELHEIVGRHHRLFVAAEDRDTAAYQAFWAGLQRGNYQADEYRRVGKNGQTVWIQASYNPVLDLDGRPVKVVKFATNITGEVTRREQIRMLSLVADATSNSVIITDVDGRIEYVNAGFVRMTGFSFEEVRGRKPGCLLQGPATSQATREKIRQKLAERLPFYDEIVNYTRDGEPYWVTLFINPVRDDDGRVNRFVAIQTDATERKTTEAQMAEMAFMARHDALTGLGNRAMFQNRLSEAMEKGSPFALLCLDLDHFKQVNDRLGHPGGDKLLRNVADRLLDCVRSTDTVARFGGDEFAVICSGTDVKDTAQATALRIIKQIKAPFSINNQEVFIGVSIGIAVSERSDCTPDLLFQHADLALYSAKHDGRGNYRHFEPAMSEHRILARTLNIEAFG